MMARGEISDMESSSDSEEEPTQEATPEEEEEIEDGEATHRLACVNLNWDVVTVEYSVFTIV